MDQPLEHRCATCPALIADSYGKCDHTQCLACLDLEHWLTRRLADRMLERAFGLTDGELDGSIEQWQQKSLTASHAGAWISWVMW